MCVSSQDSKVSKRASGLSLALAFEIERHGSADEIPQGRLIDLVAFVYVDGAPDVPVETGIEETGRVSQRRSLGKCHLDSVLVGLSGTDDAAVRPDGRAGIRGFHPLPLFDDLGICLVDDFAYLRERLRAPVAQFLELLVN